MAHLIVEAATVSAPDTVDKNIYSYTGKNYLYKSLNPRENIDRKRSNSARSHNALSDQAKKKQLDRTAQEIISSSGQAGGASSSALLVNNDAIDSDEE